MPDGRLLGFGWLAHDKLRRQPVEKSVLEWSGKEVPLTEKRGVKKRQTDTAKYNGLAWTAKSRGKLRA